MPELKFWRQAADAPSADHSGGGESFGRVAAPRPVAERLPSVALRVKDHRMQVDLSLVGVAQNQAGSGPSRVPETSTHATRGVGEVAFVPGTDEPEAATRSEPLSEEDAVPCAAELGVAAAIRARVGPELEAPLLADRERNEPRAHAALDRRASARAA